MQINREKKENFEKKSIEIAGIPARTGQILNNKRETTHRKTM